mgnify:CR=1 FL=1
MKKIIDFQKKHGLVADGIIGINTLFKIKEVFKIKTNEELAHFMGQCHHESGGFSVDTENLNYSADGLMKVFPKYFPTKILAMSYQRNPVKIANKVYSNRMGNDSEASGNGYLYRGRGAIQLTGKSNYKAFADYIGNKEIITKPELVATDYFFESALYFFNKNNIFSLCKVVDTDHITKVTKKINGGINGLLDRQELTRKYYNILE